MSGKNKVLRIPPEVIARNVAERKFSGLDRAWLSELLEKRKSNYSCVLVVETDDPTRAEQVAFHLTSSQDYSQADVLLFDPWIGLRRYDRERMRFAAVEGEEAYRPSSAECPEEGGTSSPDVGIYLRRADSSLKRQKTVLILQWLDVGKHGVPAPTLAHALRSWALDGDLLRQGSMVFLLTGDTSGLLDDATRKLVAWTRAPLANEKERRHFIRHTGQCLGLPIDDVDSQLVTISAGLGLHQLESTLLETYSKTRSFSPETLAALKSEVIRQSDLVEVQEPDVRGFKIIGGYHAMKKLVMDKFVKALKEQERALRYGVPLPRGVLLFGPPGTGKTLFARALSGEINLPFINLRTENLYSKWLGESGQRFAEAIRLAEQMSPAIVFVDEIDRFGKRQDGGDGASQESRRVFSQVLDWLGDEKRRSIIIGTTNAPRSLDEAFLREGRFDFKLPFLYPGLDARKEILRIHLAKPVPLPWELEEEEVGALVSKIAEGTEGLTGAEIEQICIRARHSGFESGRDHAVADDLLGSAKRFRINRETRAQKRQEYLTMAAEYANDELFLSELEAEN